MRMEKAGRGGAEGLTRSGIRVVTVFAASVGVVALIAAQSFLNIAMSIGMMPITGIPLPLMSYGGSSLLSSFLALGLLCNVAVRRLFLIAPRPFEWRE